MAKYRLPIFISSKSWNEWFSFSPHPDLLPISSSVLLHFLSSIKIKAKVKLRKLVDILISRAVGPNC